MRVVVRVVVWVVVWVVMWVVMRIELRAQFGSSGATQEDAGAAVAVGHGRGLSQDNWVGARGVDGALGTPALRTASAK